MVWGPKVLPDLSCLEFRTTCRPPRERRSPLVLCLSSSVPRVLGVKSRLGSYVNPSVQSPRYPFSAAHPRYSPPQLIQQSGITTPLSLFCHGRHPVCTAGLNDRLSFDHHTPISKKYRMGRTVSCFRNSFIIISCGTWCRRPNGDLLENEHPTT